MSVISCTGVSLKSLHGRLQCTYSLFVRCKGGAATCRSILHGEPDWDKLRQNPLYLIILCNISIAPVESVKERWNTGAGRGLLTQGLAQNRPEVFPLLNPSPRFRTVSGCQGSVFFHPCKRPVATTGMEEKEKIRPRKSRGRTFSSVSQLTEKLFL